MGGTFPRPATWEYVPSVSTAGTETSMKEICLRLRSTRLNAGPIDLF